MAPVIGDAWFDHDALRERLVEQHGNAGAACPACGVWRWLPLGFVPVPPMTDKVLPPLLDVPGLEGVDIAASPEWFGDGLQAFRLILVRRALADVVVDASPRDFRIVDPAFAERIDPRSLTRPLVRRSDEGPELDGSGSHAGVRSSPS